MKNKLVFAAGMAAGYVLGSRAGRESYEQLKTKAQDLWNDPKVQDTVSSTTEAIKDKAPEVQESLKGVLNKDGSGSDTLSKVKGAASDAADKAKEGADKAKDAASKGGTSVKDASPVVPASGNTGPSGGDPYEVEEAPFQDQDESTRPELGK